MPSLLPAKIASLTCIACSTFVAGLLPFAALGDDRFQIHPIALNQQHVDSLDNYTFQTFSRSPRINGANEVAFTAAINSIAGGQSKNYLFVYNGVEIIPIVEISNDVLSVDEENPEFFNKRYVDIANNGDMLLYASSGFLRSDQLSSEQGVWRVREGQLELIAHTQAGHGAIGSPGIPGLTFEAIHDARIAPDGSVAISGRVKGMGVTEADDHGIWWTSTTDTVHFIREGLPIISPLVEPGSILQSRLGNRPFSLAALNSSDQVNFEARTAPPGDPFPPRGMIGRLTPDGFRLDAVVGATTTLLGADAPSFEFTQLNTPITNASGDIVFTASVRTPGDVFSVNDSLWRKQGGVLELIAMSDTSGSWGPGLDDGSVFQHIVYESFSDVGDVVLKGQLSGPTVGPDNNTGLWVTTDEGLSLIARKGVSGMFGPSDGGTFKNFFEAVINSNGLVVFVAQSSDNARGIWAHIDGANVRIVSEYQFIDFPSVTGEPVSRMVGLFSTGSPEYPEIQLTDDGKLVFFAEFLGSPYQQGIFMVDIVPEPQSLLVLGTLSLLIFASARRSLRGQ